MRPNRPIMLPNTSTIRILTKRLGSAASAKAAVAPVIPTETPQRRLQEPTVRPPQKSAKPAAERQCDGMVVKVERKLPVK